MADKKEIKLEIQLPITDIRGDEVIMEVDFVEFKVEYKKEFRSHSGYYFLIENSYPVYAQDTNGNSISLSTIAPYLEGVEEIIQENIIDHFGKDYPEYGIEFNY